MLLYVDGFNYASEFGFVILKWDISVAMRNIKKFVKAAQRSRIELTIFIDAGIGTPEAISKWRNRREKEVKYEYRKTITSQNILMGEIFTELGVRVLYSPANLDCDDCLASYAQHDGASVLSRDKDFFRYAGKKYTQYDEFVYNKGKLSLIKKNIPDMIPSLRDILPKMEMIQKNPTLIDLTTGHYIRGVPTPLVKKCGNPHAKVGHLRRAIYAKLGYDQIEEEWPEWDSVANAVKWHKQTVTATHEFDELFNMKPQDLIRSIFDLTKPDVRSPIWNNHVFAVNAVVCELYALYHNMKLLDVINSIAKPDIIDTLVEPLVNMVIVKSESVSTGL